MLLYMSERSEVVLNTRLCPNCDGKMERVSPLEKPGWDGKFYVWEDEHHCSHCNTTEYRLVKTYGL